MKGVLVGTVEENPDEEEFLRGSDYPRKNPSPKRILITITWVEPGNRKTENRLIGSIKRFDSINRSQD